MSSKIVPKQKPKQLDLLSFFFQNQTRDVKSSNILLEKDFEAYLTDYGIAKTSKTLSHSEEGISTSSTLQGPILILTPTSTSSS